MRLVGSLVLVLASLLLSADPAAAQGAAATSPVLTPLDSLMPELEKLYIELHQSPELSLQEEKTSAKMATLLRGLGFEVTEKVGGWGVVGVMKNGAGPTVLVRTDMDALPVEEKTGLAYASKATAKNKAGDVVPVMHACGHDFHMTSWIGAATLLSRAKNRWKGTLVFIGQPAEEGGAGALSMLKDGLYSRFPKPDFAIGLHDKADGAVGTIHYTPGFALANVDSVDITFFGKGGHGAYPHTTVDPIVIASRFVVAVQTLVARENNPVDPAVVTVGSFHAGTKHNIIPDDARLQLTVRSYKDEVRKALVDGITRLAKAEAAAARAPKEPEVKVTEGTPATYNDPKLVSRVVPALRRALGEQAVVEAPPVMGGEDFSEYGRAGVPAFLWWVGAVDPAKVDAAKKEGTTLPSLHSPLFAPHPSALKTGAASLTAAALELLGKS
jgi:hippurate hydrolase